MSTPVTAALRFYLIFLVSAVAYADSAQWNLNPASGDWNTATNWTPTTVPNGPADIATFAFSNITNVSISANTEVSGLTFSETATNPYNITASPELTLTISGAGITNNSGMTHNFVTAVDAAGNRGQIVITNSATAGVSNVFTNNGAIIQNLPAGTWFVDTSSAGNATFINKGGAVSGNPLFQGGFTAFANSSTAGSGSFTNDGGIGGVGGQVLFFDTSIGGNGNFINNSGSPTGAGGYTEFFDSSSAGNGTFTNKTGTGFFGYTRFSDTSSAGNGVFTNEGTTISNLGNGGETSFQDNSTAANSTITNSGGAAFNAGGGVVYFANSSTAASATIINNGGTVSGAFGAVTAIGVFESDPATAASAMLIANGGTGGGGGGRISFSGNSAGGTSRIEVFDNGSVDISGHNAPGVTIGSIEGEGDVLLGGNNLSVGSNNFSTTFSGVIANGGFGPLLTKIDSGPKTYSDDSNVIQDAFKVYESISSNRSVFHDGGVGGSLTKIGSGTLDLEGVNTYTGDTNINRGVLQVDGSISSNTFVNRGGTLAGSGTVNGNITNRGGKISPGEAIGVPGVLAVGGNYTTWASQIAGGTLSIQIGGGNVGEVSVLDVQGNANLGGFLDPVLVNGFVPEIGQSFAFLNYASFTGFLRIRKPVFDHGRKRWSVAYSPTSAALIAVKNPNP
jgi:autotransporter-associated beta strand protein